MIEYNEKSRVFNITNGSISYMIYLNSEGILETIYFGKAIAPLTDVSALRKSNEWHDSSFTYDNVNKTEYKYSDGFKNNSAPLEIGSHGKYDKRHAPIVIKQANGSYETDFRYDSFVIYKCIKPLTELPHVRKGNFETIEFICKEKESNVYLHLYISIDLDKDIIIKSFKIENKEKNNIKILRAESLQLDLPSDKYDLIHFHGRWQNERNCVEEPLIDGIKEISSNYGRSSHEENPLVIIKEKETNNEYGVAIGLNLIYSGNFKFRAHVTSYKQTHITYGMNDEDFEWELKSGECFETPQAVISYSYNGIEKVSQNFHSFILYNLLSEKNKLPKRIPFNSWEGCFFDFDTKTVTDYIDDGAKIGTELFVLDDGWFGKRNLDNAGLGDWVVNKEKIDLHKIINHCKSKGIAFGIWFEPEMINYDSDLYRSHPEFVLSNADNKTISCIRHQFHLDFSNADVIENIYNQMKAFLDEYEIDYIKWDCNRIICEHYSNKYPSEKQGEIYHRVILGYYKLLSRICDEYPNILIEGCASGGGRFDLGTLFYTPQIWASDESDPAVRMEINYNTSIGYPLSTIGAHVNASPITNYKTKAILALFGTYGYEMNPNKLTKEEIDSLSEIADVYHKYHKSVIEEGTLYHLLDPNKSNWMAMQSVSIDKSVSLCVCMNRKKEWDRYRFLKLKGLKKDSKYLNSYDNTIQTGEYLMNIGINMSNEWCNEFDCRLIIITEQK
ncbi:MAG: alpha-galactosidase [Clostridia bacterium]|nr:alpha-galactosidase [Clostridia bacterium]